MEEGDLTSLIEGLTSAATGIHHHSASSTGSGGVLLTSHQQQQHFVVGNSFISASASSSTTETTFPPPPPPAPSPSIILRSPAAHLPTSPGRSPARPTTPASSAAATQLVQLLPAPPGGAPGGTSAQVARIQAQAAAVVAAAAQLKGKQPQQILPKPQLSVSPSSTSTHVTSPPTKPVTATVTRIINQPSPAAAPQILINSQTHPNLLLGPQIMASGGPVLVQPAGSAGAATALMLRSQATTAQGKVVTIGHAHAHTQHTFQQHAQTAAPQTLFIQQNRQQVMRIMTAQGPIQVQLQQIQTPSGPQLIAVPQNPFQQNVIVQSAPTGTLQLQAPIQIQATAVASTPTAVVATTAAVEPKPIAAKKTQQTTGGTKGKGGKKTAEVAPTASGAMGKVNPAKVMTSSLRQVRPAGLGKKKTVADGVETMLTDEKPIDNLTATINSVAIDMKSPTHRADDLSGVNEALAAGKAVTLNKRPNLTIVQKSRLDEDTDEDEKKKAAGKKVVSGGKKKNKKDENKVDLLDLMKSAGIGDEEFEDSPDDLNSNGFQAPKNLEISSNSDLLTQLQASQVSNNLRLAIGEDGRTVIIDGSNVLIPDLITDSHSHPEIIADSNLVNFSPQALATAQNQLTQLLQEHGTVTAADQQLLAQIFTVNPNSGLRNTSQATTRVTSAHQPTVSSTSQCQTMTVVNSSSNSISAVEAPSQVSLQKVDAATEYTSPAKPATPQQSNLPPGLPPLGPDSLVITNNNGVPTLVASPALMQYLQTHQGIIQFQTDPVTKTIQPSLIIPHPPPAQQQQQQQTVVQQQAEKSPRNGKSADSNSATLTNILRNQSVPSPVKMTMARLIQDNPTLLQVAKDTTGLINYKESCPSLTEAELLDIDRKIQANRNLLDQCITQEVEKSSSAVLKEAVLNKDNLGTLVKEQGIIYQVTGASVESSGAAGIPKVSVGVAAGPVTPPSASASKSKSKKKSKEQPPQPQQSPQPPQVLITSPANLPLTGNLTFNIAQLSPEQNDRLNQALNARGVTANQVAQGELTDAIKQIIHEEIRKITTGVFGNATVKFPPTPASQQSETTSSNMLLANPTLNQLLDAGSTTSSAAVNPMVALSASSAPPPGSVIIGSNGNVVAIVQGTAGGAGRNAGVPTLQLSSVKQQHLKTLHTQIQALSAKPMRTATEQTTLQKLLLEQQKVLATGKLVTTQPQTIQIVAPQQNSPGAGNRVFQQIGTNNKSSNVVSCGTSTNDIATVVAAKSDSFSSAPTLIITDSVPTSQYQPLYVSPNAKPVTKCEKGTSPIQIQMGTQTMPHLELRSSNLNSKMSTGTMTSPNTGKPQAVVAPAVFNQQQTQQQPQQISIADSKPIQRVNVAGRCPSPVVVIPRTALIEKQLRTDQAGATMPDINTPFLSKSDAVKRLIRYHVMEDKGLTERDLAAADEMFEVTAHHLLDKFRSMKEKYKYLLLMESMREVSTAEKIMVDRNFIIDERIELEELREKENNATQNLDNISSSHSDLIRQESENVEADVEVDGHGEIQSQTPELQDLKDLEGVLESDRSASTSPDTRDRASDPADINAQVQSAIDSILNLQQSSDDGDDGVPRRKRKLDNKDQNGVGAKKRARTREDDSDFDGSSDNDPVLDEAIRSILAS